MTQLRYGLDYGTSNSAIALAQEGDVQVIPIDSAAKNSRMASSVLFIEREHGDSENAKVKVQRIDNEWKLALPHNPDESKE